MAELQWNVGALKQYYTGVSKGVLFPRVGASYPAGIAWEGLTNVTESPGGDEPTDLYANNVKYATMLSAPTFGGTIEAYAYPPEFAICDGMDDSVKAGVLVSMQPRKPFGLAYRVELNSDEEGASMGYQIHLVYGALTKPSEASRATIGESVEASTFSWEFTTTPVNVTGHQPTAHLIITSTEVDAGLLAWLESQIYGGPATPATLPLPDEVLTWTA